MIIGVDGYATNSGMHGFIYYIVRLTTALAELGRDRVVLYVPSGEPVTAQGVGESAGIEVREVPFDMGGYPDRAARDVDWHQRALRDALTEDQPEVFLGTCQFLPLDWGGPSVLTIHDVAFEAHPEHYWPDSRDLYRRWGLPSARRADAILTVSQYSADDVRRYWKIFDKAIVPTPLGTALSFVPQDRQRSRELVAEYYGFSGEYLFTPSAGHARKNLGGAVRAFAGLPADVRGEVRLVLSNVRSERTEDMVRASGVSDAVVLTEVVPEHLMPHLYAGATALFYPTFYEGFGLPVLEAMACGTPVVSSTTSSVPEVAGDAALLADPTDDEAVTRALSRVLTDPGLRASLSTAGRRRSAEFSWERTARLTREVLADVTAR